MQVEPPTLRNTLNRNQIGTRLLLSGAELLPGQAMGSTTAAFEQQTGISVGPQIVGPGFACAQPAVNVTLVVKAPVIDIAQEFERGSCRYAEILAHELRHVATYAAHLEKSQKVIKDLVAARYATRPYFMAKSISELENTFTLETSDWLVPKISAQLALSVLDQRLIDTPEEYQRLSQACPQEPMPDTIRESP